MRLTNESLDALKTAKGGYDKKTLALLGVGWPPKKGWRRKLVGKKLTGAKLEAIKKELATPQALDCGTFIIVPSQARTVGKKHPRFQEIRQEFRIVG